ncbi:helix-turn-helix transcriptional regulator [Paenibacillus rhizophilus]|uniref:helix-turn-helix transcriptional regulator n=1 Tax=Paenibacillus rhizophilus TaxID=1850366 RepID=UPI0026BE42CB
MAGISLEWYTYLEQGRDIQVSVQVLESLTRVLRLDANERRHLFLLAYRQYPLEEKRAQSVISPNLQNFLDQLAACVIDVRMNVVAWNKAFCIVYGDYDSMTVRERNLVWSTFTSDYLRQIKGEYWEEGALRCLAQFRAGYGRFIEDPWWGEQIRELTQISQEFKEMWQRQEVLYAPEGNKVIYHPVAGELIFKHLSFTVTDSPELQVVINTPLDGTDTADKVKRLLSQKEFF